MRHITLTVTTLVTVPCKYWSLYGQCIGYDQRLIVNLLQSIPGELTCSAGEYCIRGWHQLLRGLNVENDTLPLVRTPISSQRGFPSNTLLPKSRVTVKVHCSPLRYCWSVTWQPRCHHCRQHTMRRSDHNCRWPDCYHHSTTLISKRRSWVNPPLRVKCFSCQQRDNSETQ